MKAKRDIVVILLILTTTMMTMANDLFAPSLPHLPVYFNATPEQVKLTVSLWTLAYGGLLLIYGPLSERFGRKPVLVGALATFTACSVLCAAAATIEQLIAARILQGAAAGAEGVLVLSIIRDLFDERGQVKTFSLYRAACAIPPLGTPILGAYMYLWFGWQANFVLLAVVSGAVTLLLWRTLIESSPTTAATGSLRSAVRDYLRLLASLSFLSYATVMSTAIGYLIVVSTAIPFVLVDVLGYGVEVFGYFQAGVMVVFVIGSIAANRLAGRLSARHILLLGIVTVIVGASLLFVVVLADGLTLTTLIVSIAMMALGNGPILATSPVLAMNVSGTATGTSAALLLTITSILGSITAVVEGRLSDGTVDALAIVMLSISLVAVGAYALAAKQR